MTRRLVVLRPEPGNAATRARARSAGFTADALAFFVVEALDWTAPDPRQYDSLLLTSANSLRFGGAELAALRALPVLAVGQHTAAAAREYGFDVVATGTGNAGQILALANRYGISYALHLTGHDRTLEVGGAIASLIPVYRSRALAIDPTALATLSGATALLHSTRAARRIGELVDAAEIDRSGIALAAFSPAIAAAAGSGWAEIAVADTPDDAALFAALAPLPATSR
nr:uroporphyrinogen-III synthase [Sphingomonas sp. TREG-RG-20F-R18-01]